MAIAGEGGAQGYLVVVDGLACLRAGAGAVQAYAGDALLCKGFELCALADAVLVGVLPNFELTVSCVCAGDLAVRIAVQVAKCVKALGGKRVVAFDGVYAKELPAGVDGAVAV